MLQNNAIVGTKPTLAENKRMEHRVPTTNCGVIRNSNTPYIGVRVRAILVLLRTHKRYKLCRRV